MISFIVSYISKKILPNGELVAIGVEDPYYEYIPIGQKKNGDIKYKKNPSRLPDNLSLNDFTILKRFRNKSYRYDMIFTLFGIRMGLNNAVQLIPLIGPFITIYWSLKLLYMVNQLDNGFPLDLQLYFLFNIIIDLLLGLIPIVGDLINIGFKANLRNYLLLKNHLFTISDYNNDLIKKEEIRPNFINNKIQPLLFKAARHAPKVELIELDDLSTTKAKDLLNSFSSSSSTVSTSPTTATSTSIKSDQPSAYMKQKRFRED